MTFVTASSSSTGSFFRRLKQRVAEGPTPAHLKALDGVEGWLAVEEAALLYDLARQVEDGCILEIGSYRGRSTVALALGARAGLGPPVFAIEPHEPFSGVLGGNFGPADRGAFYRNMLRSGCFEEVRLINLDSATVAPGWRKPIGLLWIDGDHSYEGVKRDFECWFPHLTDEAKIAFDDSLDPELGPARLIREILGRGAFEVSKTVGKVTLLHRPVSATAERDRNDQHSES